MYYQFQNFRNLNLIFLISKRDETLHKFMMKIFRKTLVFEIDLSTTAAKDAIIIPGRTNSFEKTDSMNTFARIPTLKYAL